MDVLPSLEHAARRRLRKWRAARAGRGGVTHSGGYVPLAGSTGAGGAARAVQYGYHDADGVAEAGGTLLGEDEDVAAERRLIQSGAARKALTSAVPLCMASDYTARDCAPEPVCCREAGRAGTHALLQPAVSLMMALQLPKERTWTAAHSLRLMP